MTSAASTGALARLLEQATPGPWEAGKGMFPIVTTAGSFKPLAEMAVYFERDDEAESNAALIALAPDAVRLLTDMAATIEGAKRKSGTRTRRYGGDPHMGDWYAELDALLARFAALEERAAR